jgi:hypothetical protein
VTANSEVRLLMCSKIAAVAIDPCLFVRNDATNPATQVGLATAATQVVGVSPDVRQIAGRMADYIQLGRVQIRAGGVIAVGDRIDCDASSRAITSATGVLGRAETAATAAGQLVFVTLNLPQTV